LNFRYNDKHSTLPEVVQRAIKSINRQNPLPLYHQLLQALYGVLQRNELEPGSFFATENLLQQDTGMSRSTIRKALEELVRQGLLVRITGKGTFVSLPDLQVGVSRLKSLTQELTERGMKPGTVLLSAEFITPPEHVAHELAGAEKTLCVKRVRSGNGIPLLYVCDYIPESLGFTADFDFSGSLYEALRSRGYFATSAKHTIKATIISPEIAELLGVKPRTAGLKIQRTTCDQEGKPILYEEGVGRGDLYSYTLRLQNYP